MDIKEDEFGKYANIGIMQGIIQFSNFGTASIDDATGSIGSANRREVVSALGFSDNPSKSETSRAMKTISIDTINGPKKITIHNRLSMEVMAIFNEIKQSGFNVNQVAGYCHRTINNPNRPGSPVLSMHSFGCAIDINWNVNPFVSRGKPQSGGDSSTNIRTMNSPVVQAFARHGWGWGGKYGDYMHFSKANGA